MAEIDVEVVAVEKRFWSGTAELVIAQTTEGEIGIMAGHEPVLGQLAEDGIVVIRTSDGSRKIAAVQGGFVSTTANKVTVLAESAQWADDIDLETARRELIDAGDSVAAVGAAKSRIKAAERYRA